MPSVRSGPVEAWGRRVAQLGVKAASAARDAVSAPATGVTVLIYHRVGRRTTSEVDLPAAVFAAQIAWLTDRGVVVTLDEAVRRLSSDDPADQRDGVVITFDDGTADFADIALPILIDAGAPATIYLATDFIEHQRAFPGDGRPLSWPALADAVGSGLVTVGSHTDTHLLLDRATPEGAQRELTRSVDLIGERLGTRVDHFAYPKALAASPAVEPLVRARFRSAAVAGTRANRFGATDVHRLARSPVQFGDPPWAFRRKAQGGMGLEDDLRSWRNRRGYAGAVT